MVKQVVSQADDVEARLREMILNMDLGPGERLTERWAESQLGASRTPIRTALVRLMGEGLVAREGRGWIVTPLDLNELEELFVYREILEASAMRLAAPHINELVLDELEATFCQPKVYANIDEAHQAGTDFHLRLAGLSGNSFIYRGIADAINRLARARWLDTAGDHDGWEQHQVIIAALRAGNTELAVSHLVTHLQESRERLLAVLKTMRRSMRARGGVIVSP